MAKETKAAKTARLKVEKQDRINKAIRAWESESVAKLKEDGENGSHPVPKPHNSK